MAYIQLRKPNLTVVGVSGLCLRYARQVYGIGPKYLYAWNAWTNSKQHRTRTLPKVSVPLWFSYVRYGINVGHVIVYVPGKGFYSSPIAGKKFFRTLAEFEGYATNCKYVGWSENMNGVAIVKYVSSTTAVYHTVVSGDTVGKLATRYGSSITSIVNWNKPNYPTMTANFIKIGWKLRVR